VSVSGTIIAAGAPGATVNGNRHRGAVYVFTEPASGWADETQAAKLTATGGAEGAEGGVLGDSVVVSGTIIAAGAPGATVNGSTGQGAVYVFTEPASGWADETQAAKLTATHGGAFDELGRSVAVSGTTIAAGAPGATVNGNYGQGAVYLFTRQPVAVSTRLSAAKITAGGHVHDTAVLSGATATAGGAVSYRYYASYGACRADVAAFTRGTRPSRGISAGTVTLAHAAVPRSRNIRFGRARTWYWAAFYSGDTSNNRAASNCGEKLTVTTPGG
jgi:FG-GAP repeat